MKHLLSLLLLPLTAVAEFRCEVCTEVLPTATATATSTPTRAPTVTVMPAATATAQAQPIPALAMYEANMRTYGRQVCDGPLKTATSYSDSVHEYDLAWVFAQIAAYTHDSSWFDCVARAQAVYRDNYVPSLGTQIPGYRIFPHGLAEDFKRTANAKNFSAFQSLLTNSWVVPQPWNKNNMPNAVYQRENSYALVTHLRAPDFGLAINRPAVELFKTNALGHLDQMFVTKTVPYRKPFMTSLVAEALVEYYEQVAKDPAIVTKIAASADYEWANLWNPTAKAFKYSDDTCTSVANCPSRGDWGGPQNTTGNCGTCVSPDLNLFIAPRWYWLWSVTRDPKYLAQGDAIWASGVTATANLGKGKQFAQYMRWSILGLKRRDGR